VKQEKVEVFGRNAAELERGMAEQNRIEWENTQLWKAALEALMRARQHSAEHRKLDWRTFDEICKAVIAWLVEDSEDRHPVALAILANQAVKAVGDLNQIVENIRSGLSDQKSASEEKETLDNLKPLARRLPCWPALNFLHQKPNSRFHELAKDLELGAESFLKISSGAKYDLYLAHNRLVYTILRELQEFWKTKSFFDWQIAGIASDQMKALISESIGMLPLRTVEADKWARRILLPYAELRFGGHDNVSKLLDMARFSKRKQFTDKGQKGSYEKEEMIKNLAGGFRAIIHDGFTQ
jgi:hypothetical protein